MHKSSGTLTQKFNMSIDINAILETIGEMLKTNIEEALNSITDGCELETPYFEDDCIVIEGEYNTSYTYTAYEATMTDPPEEYFDRNIESLDADSIKNYILKHIQPTTISPTDIINKMNINIDEDENDIDLSEYEPDWDCMPGGHDYYD